MTTTAPDPRALVLNVPHIVDEILASVDRSTLVPCLRIKALHDSAGKRLYHTVRVDSGTMASFFRSAQLPSSLRTFLWPGYALTTRPTSSDFKTPLLAHVRVLSLGSHAPFPGVCSPGPAGLLPNLHTLRIVRSPDTTGLRLLPLCGHSTYCRLVGKLAPRKLVIRNLDEREDYLPSRWPARAPHEIVWVLPTDGRRSRRQPTNNDGELALLPTAKAKFIYHETWEVSGTHVSFLTYGVPRTVISQYIDMVLELAQNMAANFLALRSDLPMDEVDTHINTDDLARWRRFIPGGQALTPDKIVAVFNNALSRTERELLAHNTFHMWHYAALDEAERAYELDDGSMGVTSPAHHLLEIPRVVDRLLADVDKRTLVACLYVKPLHAAARTELRLTTKAATAGSIIANSQHIVDAILAHADRLTLVTALRVNATWLDAAGKVLYHTVRVDRFNITSFFRGALVGTDTNEDTGCAGASCARFGEKVGVPAQSPGKTRGQKKNARKAKMKKSASVTNFKASLLARVHVLSLGAHHGCVCTLYGPHMPSLLRHLDTLRIVPAPASTHTLQPLCDARECALFACATPRRVVLRNLDGGSGPSWPQYLPFDGDAPFAEVVWVLPTKGERYGDDGGLIGAGQFGRAATTYVFADWELWRAPAGSSLANFFDVVNNKRFPVLPSDVIYVVGSPSFGPPPTVVGLERLQFTARGADDVVGTFKHHFPHVHLDNDRLLRMVRDELRTQALQCALLTGQYDPADCPEWITYHTLDEYAALPESHGVLHDGMREALEMAERDGVELGVEFVPQHNGMFDLKTSFTHILLQIPHIVEAILAPLDRRTLLSCLRVHLLHDSAGKLLYRTVRVHRSNLATFFLGALVGTRTEETGCSGAGCTRFTHETVMYLSRGKLQRQLEQEEEEAKTVDSGANTTNFKAPLLAYVRVLSLSSHHVCACRLYAPHLATILPNLRTLRIVPAPASDHTLERLCDARECAVFASAVARRLVLCNLDAHAGALSGWPLRARYDERPPFKHVVWVLPTSGAGYAGRGIKFSRGFFGPTPHTYVFADWEVWVPPAGWDLRRRRLPPVNPSDVVHAIGGAGDTCRSPSPTVVGLERVALRDYGDEIGRMFAHSAHLRCDSAHLRQLVHDKLDASARDSNNDGITEPAPVVFHTLEEYALDPESRGVLDDGMRDDPPEPPKPTPTPTQAPPTPTPVPAPPAPTGRRGEPYVLHPNCREPLKTAIHVFCNIM
ncbi:uncharacterized protein LOC62_01G001633 [Vanrija pseudolonga]|uniref:Uncharacterized protein n=1 Tax=Vanrija pseudolonga TaxID=143232 RepID=A0AAF0Y125_9TREE|nr:hypothetical protein LOC62_01G001633 [Vanrija pseudolonga]